MCENDRRKVFPAAEKIFHRTMTIFFLFSFHIYLVATSRFQQHKNFPRWLLSRKKSITRDNMHTTYTCMSKTHKFNFQIIQFSRIARPFQTSMIAKSVFRRASVTNIYARTKSHASSLFGYATVRQIAPAAMTRECHFVRT